MSGALEKSLAILEYLTQHPHGIALAKLSTDLNLPRSNCHRLLGELAKYGYIRQTVQHGDYALTTKLASMGLSFLSKSGVVDIAQPILADLAQITGELVRLAVVDGDRLTLVAKEQGARSGLRYDPDMGMDLKLSCSAAGHAWLMTLSDDRAIEAVARQGLGRSDNFGPDAPATIKDLQALLDEHRKRGFSVVRDMFAPGMSGMAAPVQLRGEAATGVVVIAGPSLRLTEQRLVEFGPALLHAAGELAMASVSSPLFTNTSVAEGLQQGARG